jgi:hypothetical protein
MSAHKKSRDWLPALLGVLLVIGAARLVYVEYWLQVMTIQVRADTAFERNMAARCSQTVPSVKSETRASE